MNYIRLLHNYIRFKNFIKRLLLELNGQLREMGSKNQSVFTDN